MKPSPFLYLLLLVCINHPLKAQLSKDIALQLSELPLKCINITFPNKTSHAAQSKEDAVLLPNELHPVFYGCFDWHSSVHGHWMLVKLIKQFPDIENKNKIIETLNNSFDHNKMVLEAAYFSKYELGKIFERTYGWAWLLKLDEELYTWHHPLGKKWHAALQPLTQVIVSLWKDYLPKQTYPNRTGVHPNAAFGLAFALDWANVVKDTSFANAIKQKAMDFYLNNQNIPAYLEPDGSDFFSPSLLAADLMARILPQQKFTEWFNLYYEERSINRLLERPQVSDRNDYQIVHLDGLYFSRAWCMKGIANKLPDNHKYKYILKDIAKEFIIASTKNIFEGNYGGEHWLASFAIYALAVD